MDYLPLDLLTTILDFNDTATDVRASELTCKLFKEASRRRTSLTFYVLPWPIVARYPRLTRATGLITSICEAVFQSKIQQLKVSIDLTRHFYSPLLLNDDYWNYEVTMPRDNMQVIAWIAKYPRERVMVYDNVMDAAGIHIYDRHNRRRMYDWTPTALVVDSMAAFTIPTVKVYRAVYGNGPHVSIFLGMIGDSCFLSDLGDTRVNELIVCVTTSDIGQGYEELVNSLKGLNIGKLTHLTDREEMNSVFQQLWQQTWTEPPCQFDVRWNDRVTEYYNPSPSEESWIERMAELNRFPSDVLGHIFSFNDTAADVWAVELTSKLFKNVSRTHRTSLTFHALPWPIIARYPRLQTANGLITGACEAVFQSKIQRLRLSADIDAPFHRVGSDWTNIEASMSSIVRLLEWTLQHQRAEVTVHTNFVHQEQPIRDRALLFRWSATRLIINQPDVAKAAVITIHRQFFPKGEVIIKLGGPAMFWPYDWAIILSGITPTEVHVWLDHSVTPDKVKQLDSIVKCPIVFTPSQEMKETDITQICSLLTNPSVRRLPSISGAAWLESRAWTKTEAKAFPPS